MTPTASPGDSQTASLEPSPVNPLPPSPNALPAEGLLAAVFAILLFTVVANAAGSCATRKGED